MKRSSRLCNLCVICVGVMLLAGCGKESEPAATEGLTVSPPDATPTTPTAAAQNMPSAQEVVSDRSIDYIQGLVNRGALDQARQALAQLEGKQLTPEQQRKVEGLKSKIPNN